MRVIKDADVRKNEILDAAHALFSQRGFDGTSISDIIGKVDVARGTIYYHFKSKEDILDALINRYSDGLIDAVQKAADNKDVPVMERLANALAAMNIEESTGQELIEQMHRPQNALMHQKSRKALLMGVTPILAEVICEGVKEGVFATPFPYESMELLMAYVSTVFDDGFLALTEQERMPRIQAFIHNAEILFGVPKGGFKWMKELFGIKDNDNERCPK